MIIMEFEEMKRIWDTQNNEHVYAINETALHKKIIGRKKYTSVSAGRAELIVIFSNILAIGIMTVSGIMKGEVSVFTYALGAVLLFIAIFMTMSRIRRMRSQDKFEASMLGDLEHAIANARYQVWFSRIARLGLLPIAVITLVAVWDGDTSWWKWLLILAFFAVMYFLSGKERNCTVRQMKKLEALRDNLQKEN
ncbi:hypothetical protein JMN32_15825 [Fulvivirga sp. 29W222]|uniref:Uncharacterized protein n=1 Tax=Fulvivirga marina TaxID=2494733 RepID=A0A937G0D4_9BACT|nr:hypothetical protein [Fulvivirga marina]MBL6447788.1 hypothetical protein [Fulvivirga marina]